MMADRVPGGSIVAVVATADRVAGPGREAIRPRLEAAAAVRSGRLLVVTCHRVELYVDAPDPEELASLRAIAAAEPGTRLLDGPAAARHAIALAIGLESAVLAEDEILHQLRAAVAATRERGPLGPGLEAVMTAALRAGRRARSWRPGPARSLADVAIERTLGTRRDLEGAGILIVGAGVMGTAVARSAQRRGASLRVASRRLDRAEALAADVGGSTLPFDPGPEAVGRAALVVVALAGPWSISPATVAALADGPPVVDLSQPGAVPAAARSLGARIMTIDDLAAHERGRSAARARGVGSAAGALSAGPAAGPTAASEARFRRRLVALAERTEAELAARLAERRSGDVAGALAERLEAERRAELEAFWRGRPDLEPAERAAIEAMTRHLADRFLRDPLERLGRDVDGRRGAAARELFGL
jgi:glutamyl-tRNA reductase